MLPEKTKPKHGLTNEICMRYNLDAVSQRILRHLLLFPKARLKDLCEITGFSIEGCAKRLRRPNMVAALAEINGTTNEHIERAQRVGAIRLQHIAENGKDRDAIEATKVAAVIGAQAVQDTGAQYRKLPTEEDALKIIAADPAKEDVGEITDADLVFED